MSGEHALEPSEEVDERHIELARHEGEAYQRAAMHMIEAVADVGDVTEAGDYVVGFAQEEAEGTYRMVDGDLRWQEPTDTENCHLEILVADAASGRFLPEMNPRATLTHEDGTTVGPMEIPFMWHPGVFHYGRNLELPGEGTYTIEIELGPAAFPRHDETNGDRFTEQVRARFENADLTTGRE